MRLYFVQALIKGVWYEWTVLALGKEGAMRAVERFPGFTDMGVPHAMEAFECDLQAAVVAAPKMENEEGTAK